MVRSAWFASISPKFRTNEERKHGRNLTRRHNRYNDRVPIKIIIVILLQRFHSCIKNRRIETVASTGILTTCINILLRNSMLSVKQSLTVAVYNTKYLYRNVYTYTLQPPAGPSYHHTSCCACLNDCIQVL